MHGDTYTHIRMHMYLRDRALLSWEPMTLTEEPKLLTSLAPSLHSYGVGCLSFTLVRSSSYCCEKTPRTKINLGIKGLLSSSSFGKAKAGPWTQELKQKPWKEAAYWLVPCSLFSLLSDSTLDDQLRGCTALRGLGFPTSIIIQENTSHSCPQASLVGSFSQPRFPFPKWP